MGIDQFVVTTELDASYLDSRAEGRALMRRLRTELRRLEQADDRLRRPRIRRSRQCRRSLEITVTVAAPSYFEAADHSIVALRTCIHAAGESTAGWNDLDARSGLVECIGAPATAGPGWEPPPMPASWALPAPPLQSE